MGDDIEINKLTFTLSKTLVFVDLFTDHIYFNKTRRCNSKLIEYSNLLTYTSTNTNLLELFTTGYFCSREWGHMCNFGCSNFRVQNFTKSTYLIDKYDRVSNSLIYKSLSIYLSHHVSRQSAISSAVYAWSQNFLIIRNNKS